MPITFADFAQVFPDATPLDAHARLSLASVETRTYCLTDEEDR